MNKIYFIIITLFVTLFCVNSVQASVTVDFGSFSGVDYNNGNPNPTNVTATFDITNDESTPLTVSTLTIDSVSMGFYSISAGDWSCGYVETHSAPNFERATTCMPNNVLVVPPNDTTSVSLVFFFEDTSSAGITHPNAVGLTSVVLNGNTANPVNADLGGFDWNIDAVDDSTSTPEVNKKENGIVRGYVYFDDNDNDKRDKNEQGVEGIRIKLHYAGPNDKFDTNDDKRYTDKTNEQGKYRFNDLPSGRYRLKIEDGQMIEFYLTSEKDALNGKSNFSLDEGETKERDFGYDRDRDSNGNPKNNNLSYLQSGFTLSINNIINYFVALIK